MKEKKSHPEAFHVKWKVCFVSVCASQGNFFFFSVHVPSFFYLTIFAFMVTRNNELGLSLLKTFFSLMLIQKLITTNYDLIELWVKLWTIMTRKYIYIHTHTQCTHTRLCAHTTMSRKWQNNYTLPKITRVSAPHSFRQLFQPFKLLLKGSCFQFLCWAVTSYSLNINT